MELPQTNWLLYVSAFVFVFFCVFVLVFAYLCICIRVEAELVLDPVNFPLLYASVCPPRDYRPSHKYHSPQILLSILHSHIIKFILNHFESIS